MCSSHLNDASQRMLRPCCVDADLLLPCAGQQHVRDPPYALPVDVSRPSAGPCMLPDCSNPLLWFGLLGSSQVCVCHRNVPPSIRTCLLPSPALLGANRNSAIFDSACASI